MKKPMFAVERGMITGSHSDSANWSVPSDADARFDKEVTLDAAAAAQDGDRVEIHPGSYFDCAVWRASMG